MEFVARRFYKWDEIDFEYYSVIQIKRDFFNYFSKPDRETIENIKTIMFNNMYGDKMDTALHFLSRGIAGHNEDKNFCEYVGNRDCGKSNQYDALSYAFEEYVKPLNLDNILCSRQLQGEATNDTNKKLYWLMDFEFVRLGISQETPTIDSGLKIKSSIQKKISGGGDTLVARRNYDRTDTHFKIDTTFGYFGNNSLLFDNNDCLEHLISFCSVNQFKTQDEIDDLRESGKSELELNRYKLKDFTLKEKIKQVEWRNALVYLIYENYKSIPVNIKQNDIDEDDVICYVDIIKSKYEITNNENDYVLCKSLHDDFKTLDKKKIVSELQSINIFKKKCKVRGDMRDKWCYYGLKYIGYENNDF